MMRGTLLLLGLVAATAVRARLVGELNTWLAVVGPLLAVSLGLVVVVFAYDRASFFWGAIGQTPLKGIGQNRKPSKAQGRHQ